MKTDKEKQEYFMELWSPVHDKLVRFARCMAHDREEACDLVSDTLLIAYQNLEKLKHEQAFLSYVFSIASRSYQRNRRRQSMFGLFDWQSARQIPSSELSPDLQVDIQVLYTALAQLPSKQREALVLFEITGFSIEEIRRVQGGTISGVKSRLRRGREKLGVILTTEIDPQQNSYNDLLGNARSECTTGNLLSEQNPFPSAQIITEIQL